MAIKCCGNCAKCEPLANGDIDDVMVCQLRVVMLRTERIEDKFGKLFNAFTSAMEARKSGAHAVDIELSEKEVEISKTKKDEKQM